MENSQKTCDDLFTPPPKGMAQKRIRMQQSQHFLQPESEEQDPGLPAPFLRSPKENGDVAARCTPRTTRRMKPPPLLTLMLTLHAFPAALEGGIASASPRDMPLW
nr:uncharacterized protein LOC113822026 [Penaeus vannamei]